MAGIRKIDWDALENWYYCKHLPETCAQLGAEGKISTEITRYATLLTNLSENPNNRSLRESVVSDLEKSIAKEVEKVRNNDMILKVVSETVGEQEKTESVFGYLLRGTYLELLVLGAAPLVQPIIDEYEKKKTFSSKKVFEETEKNYLNEWPFWKVWQAADDLKLEIEANFQTYFLTTLIYGDGRRESFYGSQKIIPITKDIDTKMKEILKEAKKRALNASNEALLPIISEEKKEVKNAVNKYITPYVQKLIDNSAPMLGEVTR